MRIKAFRLFLAAIPSLLFATGTFSQTNNSPVVFTVAGGGLPAGVPATSTGIGAGESIAVDHMGNLFIADPDNYVIRKVNQNGILTIVAGNGTPSTAVDLPFYYSQGNPRKIGDGGPAVNAEFSRPFSVAVDGTANLYINDSNSLIRKVDSNGIITTVAGTGVGGFSGDGGPAVGAQISLGGMAADSLGNLYIAQFLSSCTGGTAGSMVIRKVDIFGVINTVAGNGTCGFSGDGGPAINAAISPSSIAVDNNGNMYIADGIADVFNCISDTFGSPRIRKISTNGVITTVAGNGTGGFSGDGGPATSAQILAGSVAVDTAGNVFFLDGALNSISSWSRIRKVDASGVITTVAGNGTVGFSGDGGPATTAELKGEYIAADIFGDLFVSGEIATLVGGKVRKINSVGIISTYAGNGTLGYAGENKQATNVEIDNPSGVAVDNSGNLYIGDWNNYKIRKVDTAGQITTIAGIGTPCFGTCGDVGPATSVQIGSPLGITMDTNGNL
jgi:hypothetical protein